MYNMLTKIKLNPIVLSSIFCVLLLSLRVYFSHNITFIFLVWNLFLAWIPYWISEYLMKRKNDSKKLHLLFLGGIWLLFFPNAPYMLTDLIHLKPRHDVPAWFDLILLISFAWSGVLLAYKSLNNIQRIIEHYFGKIKGLFFVIFCMFISGYGIYLGRFERFNSWDIITQPIGLLYEIKESLIHPFHHIHTFGMTFFLGIFLTLGYFSIFKLKESQQEI